MNEATDTLCVLKKHRHGDLNVYEFLKNHNCKNIPAVYDYSIEEDGIWVMEEYVEGVTLDEYLPLHKDPKERLDLIHQLLDAVEYCHNAKPPIINRDLKMSNIMVRNDGTLKLIDFDASKIYKPGESRDTELLGTHGNAAPEQYGFSQSDKRTDIYALGILIDKIMPGRFKEVVKRATGMDPKYRYQNIKQLRDALRGRKKYSTPTTIGILAASLVFCFAAVFMYSFFFRTINKARNVAVDATFISEDYTEEELSYLISHPDYKTATELEQSLNNGIDPLGKVVRFRAGTIKHPIYATENVWAGKHLNFYSTEPTGIETGDTVTARIVHFNHMGSHWFLGYEILDISED
ncbi:MAG: protein kinase [Clostridiales bacterium]|nr:protein kinase [Clostridiales bacterium]